MSEAPSLGDFFKSKGKKKIKASNLNKDTTTAKPEEKKKTAKSAEDDAWEEEQVVAQTMKVEVAGKLTREEQKDTAEDTTAPAWGNASKSKESASAPNVNEKKFPSLAKSVGSINIDDGSDGKVNIATSKNHFAALEGEDDDDEGVKRPKNIAPAMVTKKKGERETVALAREKNKWTTPKKDSQKKEGEDDEDEDEDEAEDDEPAPAAEEEARKKKLAEKKEDKKAKKVAEAEEEEEKEVEEDLLIVADLVKSKEKYKGRKKLPTVDLPAEELEEEKENKPKPQVGGKKKKFVAEEETEKKLAYADW